MSNLVLNEFLPKIQAILRKHSYTKSDRDSTDDFEDSSKEAD